MAFFEPQGGPLRRRRGSGAGPARGHGGGPAAVVGPAGDGFEPACVVLVVLLTLVGVFRR
ncbi:hypothetical protein QJS66_14550 [Kocuria rhizophila]|nr:hypothetical protein QJS66_14550 [Kocuria rhizophila]